VLGLEGEAETSKSQLLEDEEPDTSTLIWT
jgi:hypothetical protein